MKKSIKTIKRRILFAEDHPEERIVVANHLRDEMEWDLTEVLNPEQTIQCLKEFADDPYDAVILDLMMPEGNAHGGAQVLEFLKKQDGAKQRVTPVILASAWGYNGPAQTAKAIYPEAVRSIFTKPFSLRELIDAVEAVFDPPIASKTPK